MDTSKESNIIAVDDGHSLVPCTNCDTPIKVKNALIELLNGGTVSSLNWAHEQHVCPQCGFRIIGMIAGFSIPHIKLAWVALPPEQKESAIERVSADILKKMPKRKM